MLKNTDLLLLLTELEKEGNTEARKYIKDVLVSPSLNMTALKFINDARALDVTEFYEQLRKSYNANKSPLFKKIVKEDLTPYETIITLSSLNLQILLFAKHLPADKLPLFLSHARGEEITRVLNNYYKTYDITPCIKLLALVKSDLKAFQSIK